MSHDHGSHSDSPPISGAVATGLCFVCGVAGWAVSRWIGSQEPEFPGPGFQGTDSHWLAKFPFVPYALYGLAYVAGGLGPAGNALSSLRRGQLNVDLLMVLAAAGAAAIGDWGEGAVLLFLFSLSGTLEAFAMHRTTRSIESLIKLRPREAWLVEPASADDRKVAVDTLSVGDRVRVKPGERFPVDGTVDEGETWADEATLTGESEPVHKPAGAEVFAGTINVRGVVRVLMTRAVADTTLERIVHMVQEAQAQKTPTQRFVESWQRPYVLGVLLAATLVFVGARFLHSENWSDAFYHSMVMLVAASPCAVVVSSPAVMLSAIARAGRHGVLFKGAVHVESLGAVDVIAFDKTGTVTEGRPRVAEIWTPPGVDATRMLGLAATIERRSEHPLGVPIVDEARLRDAPLSAEPIVDFHSHTGLGVHGRVGGVWVGVGREGLFASHDVALPPVLLEQAARVRDSGQTALIVAAAEADVYGVIAVADQPRPEAADAIRNLKRLGIRRVVILTGDHEKVARGIANRLGADDVRAGLMPDQKVVELRKLAENGGLVAMVGDGVNDAPALAAARVGIAMGAAGTDVALEVADVVLMGDDLRALPLAVWLSRQARRRVRQNMIFAFGMIGLLVLGSFANLPLWLGVLGHEGSTVLVVFNGLRLLRERAPSWR